MFEDPASLRCRTHAHDSGITLVSRSGLDFLFDAGHMAFFQCGGVRLMLAVPENADVDHPSSIVYFRVGDIQSSHAELSARGVPFDDDPRLIARMPDHDLWMAFFRDPDHNLLGLMAEVRPPAAR